MEFMKRYILIGIAILVVFACGFMVGKKPWNHEEKPVIPYIKIQETTYDDIMDWDPGVLGEGLELAHGIATYHRLSDGTTMQVIYSYDYLVEYYWIYNEYDMFRKNTQNN